MKEPGCLGYIGDYTTQLNGDYFINHYNKDIIRIPIKQPVFHGIHNRDPGFFRVSNSVSLPFMLIKAAIAMI